MIHRRILISILAVSLSPMVPVALPQSPAPFAPEAHSGWNVLFGHPEFEGAGSMALSHLRKAFQTITTERETVIASLRTKAELEEYRAAARAKLMEALGELPERTPLHVKLAGRLERGDYAVENVIFQSRPHYYVTANVYVPLRFNAPFPAVLCPVGHWGTGKAFEDYQRLGIYLARRGFLVLVYDLPGQGERLIYYDSVLGRSLVDPATSEYYVTIEHGAAVGPVTLVSGNLAPYLVWDGLRALDYLCERKDVDRERIACTGTSGGGLQTELLSALDERIKVSIPVSYGGCAADHPDRPGLTMADVDALIAPRPLLMLHATGDSRSSVLGKRKRYEAVANVYRLLEADDRTAFLIGEGRHGYLQNLRETAFQWLSRWLRSADPDPSSLPEPSTAIEPDSSLACTTTGQVKTALSAETILSLNRKRASAIRTRVPPPGRAEDVPEWRDRLRDEVLGRIRLPEQTTPLNAKHLGRVDKGGYELEKVVYFSEPEIYVSALLFLPKTQGTKPAVLFINEGGKSADGVAENYLEPLARAGYVVLAVDPRGTGETMPPTESPYNQRNYRAFTQDSEADLFYGALRAGKTILGLRVFDVMRGVDYLHGRQEAGRDRITVIGQGAGGLLALYAAALDRRIQSVVCTRTLIDYSAILESELYTHRFSGFVPGVLQAFDLPDLAASIAPRPLLVLNPVNQQMQRIGVETASDRYRSAGTVYNLLGAGERFRIAHASSVEETVSKYLEHLGR